MPTAYPEPLRRAALALLPERWLEARRPRRKQGWWREAGVVFVHVPRAAGTSVTTTLYGQFLGHFTASQIAEKCEADVVALPRFAIVRNPWDRLVSAYEFARAGEGRGGPQSVTVADPAQYRIPAFDSFERFVEEWLAPATDRGAIDRLDGIFRTQSYYVNGPDGALLVDHCGRLEAMAETEEWLSQTLGRRIEFPRHNASPRDATESYYTPALRETVRRIYADDIKAFGYD